MKNKKFKFGVEIECGRKNYNDNFLTTKFSKDFKKKFKRWIVGNDWSIHNFKHTFEFKSPILSLKKLNQLKEVLSYLEKQKIKVNNSCGLHVHVDTPKNIEAKKIAILYAILQKQINKVAKRERNTYCHQTQILDVFNFNCNSLDYEKYKSVNIRPLRCKKKNIEFRQHYATLNYHRMRRWILFLKRLKTKSDNCSLKQIVNMYFLTQKQKEKLFRSLI